MTLCEEFLTEKDIRALLEAVSDVRYVSTYHKYNNYLKENNNIFSNIIEKLLSYIKNKKFFEEWNIYEETLPLDKNEIKLLIKVLDIVLEIHSDDELSTYVGCDKDFARLIKEKLLKFLPLMGAVSIKNNF